MPGRKMLRDLMSINDIYHFADQIVDMLREDYGTYDADSLDEVLVEETFAQRLNARGYDVKPWSAAVAPAPPALRGPAPAVVPVTVVRPRRPAGSGMRPGNDRPGPADRGDRPIGRDRPGNFDRNDRGQGGDRPISQDRGERPIGGDRPGLPIRGERPMGGDRPPVNGDRPPVMNRAVERPVPNDRPMGTDRGGERPVSNERPASINRPPSLERPTSNDALVSADRAPEQLLSNDRVVNVEPQVKPVDNVESTTKIEQASGSSSANGEQPVPAAQAPTVEQPAASTRPASTRSTRKPIVNDSAIGPDSATRTTRRRTAAATEQSEEPAAPKQRRTRTPRSSSNSES